MGTLLGVLAVGSIMATMVVDPLFAVAAIGFGIAAMMHDAI